MIAALSWRAAQALFVVLLVGVLTYLLMQSLPGDMAWRIAAGRYGYDLVDAAAASKVAAELSSQTGLSGLLQWLWSALQFDFGPSLVSGESVAHEVLWQLGHTLQLAAIALLLTLLMSLPVGVWAGLNPQGVVDRALFWLSSLLRAIPHFALGLLLIVLFAITLKILPGAGAGQWQHSVLPAFTLAIGLSALGARVTRNLMFEVAQSAWYRWGRQKGLSPTRLFWQHGWRNLGAPLVTWLAVQFVWLVEGVVVVETLFAWPGIGHALVHAIFARDIPVVQASAMLLGLLFVVLNACTDVICYWLDPRGRQA
ncbi:ABC transporter permease [Enterobacterales bacterium CwR94]|nr:ABC transporter permease [Enterobacterales bacterium CwR94]